MNNYSCDASNNRKCAYYYNHDIIASLSGLRLACRKWNVTANKFVAETFLGSSRLNAFCPNNACFAALRAAILYANKSVRCLSVKHVVAPLLSPSFQLSSSILFLGVVRLFAMVCPTKDAAAQSVSSCLLPLFVVIERELGAALISRLRMSVKFHLFTPVCVCKL